MVFKKKDKKIAPNPGIMPKYSNFYMDSGRKMLLAWTWIPRLKKMIVVFFFLAIIGALGSVYSVFVRQEAMLFMTFADGTIACAPMVDQTGQPIRRSNSSQQVCDKLRAPIVEKKG